MEIVIQPTPAEVDSTVADIVEGYVRAGGDDARSRNGVVADRNLS